MAERGQLINEALHWHNLAMDAREHDNDRVTDNEDDEGFEATGG